MNSLTTSMNLVQLKQKCRKKFLRYFPNGFKDENYLSWERDFKWDAHKKWDSVLNKEKFTELVEQKKYQEIVQAVLKIESRTILLFSFEKMALRDGVKDPEGAKIFSQALFQVLYGKGSLETRFDNWIEAVEQLPRRQTRVLTWPIITVFPFLANPKIHSYLKPTVTKKAMEAYGLQFPYQSRPSGQAYMQYLHVCKKVRTDLEDLLPRDFIDIQSFLWVQGSDEYP